MDIIFKGETLSGEILESNSILQGNKPGGIRIFLKKERDKKSMGHWVECKTDKMRRQSVIVMITPNNEPVVRGNFKELCEEFGFPYHSLKTFKSPITYKEAIIYRVPFL